MNLKEKLSFSRHFLKWLGLKRESFLSRKIPWFLGFLIYFCMGKDFWKFGVRMTCGVQRSGTIPWTRSWAGGPEGVESMVHGGPRTVDRGW